MCITYTHVCSLFSLCQPLNADTAACAGAVRLIEPWSHYVVARQQPFSCACVTYVWALVQHMWLTLVRVREGRLFVQTIERDNVLFLHNNSSAHVTTVSTHECTLLLLLAFGLYLPLPLFRIESATCLNLTESMPQLPVPPRKTRLPSSLVVRIYKKNLIILPQYKFSTTTATLEKERMSVFCNLFS